MNAISYLKRIIFKLLAVMLCLFILGEVNYPLLSPQSRLAIFAMLGLTLVFLKYPLHRRFEGVLFFKILDSVFIVAVVYCFGYVVIQTEPVFKRFWFDHTIGKRLF